MGAKRKLFVSNLEHSVVSRDLIEFFSRHGDVLAASVVIDRQTGRSRGFGFVEMATPEQAEKAMELLAGAELRGRGVRISPARERDEPPVEQVGTRSRLRLPFKLITRQKPPGSET